MKIIFILSDTGWFSRQNAWFHKELSSENTWKATTQTLCKAKNND